MPLYAKLIWKIDRKDKKCLEREDFAWFSVFRCDLEVFVESLLGFEAEKFEKKNFPPNLLQMHFLTILNNFREKKFFD